jgi:nicotinamide mononucleotide adenylyltransferase
MNKKIALFSGRFSPPHLGHILTIAQLLWDYEKVIVCVLDYPGRNGCSVEVAINIFNSVFHLFNVDKSRIYVTYNTTHFGKITEEEIRLICWNQTNVSDMSKLTYVGGNVSVNNHIKSLGFIEVEFRPRSLFYSSTAIRKEIKREEKGDKEGEKK